MNRLAAMLFMAGMPATLMAADCDCYTYPFKPNPPCYGDCVAQLSGPKIDELASVKGLPKETGREIRDLAASRNRSKIDFGNIKNAVDLHKETGKPLHARDKDM